MLAWIAIPSGRPLSFVAVAAFVLVVGCDNHQESPAAPRVPLAKQVAAARATNPARQVITPDDLNDSIANHVPGFGGFYVDEARNLVVWSKDTTRGREIEGWIHHFVAASDLVGLPLVVRQAAYDVRDLRKWKWNLENTLDQVDWRAADVDERENRVFFGVATAEAAQQLRNALAAAGVPTNAVNVDVISGTVTQTPDNRFITTGVRPMPGAVGLGPGKYDLGTGCSFGFLVKLDTTSTQYYGVGASHCTATLDANDHTAWWQYEDSVLTETYEAPFTSTLSHGIGPNPCPSGKTCRYADAVLYTVPSAFTNVGYGKIVATTDSTNLFSGGTAGFVVDTSVSPYRSYNIYTETTMGSFHVGDIVHKIGVGSGHSYGPVYRTCVDEVPGNHIPPGGSRTGSLYVCQMWADAYTYPGDSGAPVFDTINGITILEGITWEIEYDGVTGKPYMVFSPIDGIHFDLGPFAAYRGGSVY